MIRVWYAVHRHVLVVVIKKVWPIPINEGYQPYLQIIKTWLFIVF